jgi:hypothetical protein
MRFQLLVESLSIAKLFADYNIAFVTSEKSEPMETLQNGKAESFPRI